jgi:1,4-alpha-glucan branching enzyme
MSQASTREKTKRHRVMLAMEAPDAKEVVLAGDFNKWNAKSHPMKKDKGGVWKRSAMLPPGRYEYKFLVDGQWRNDPKNDKTCPNRFGTRNSVLTIS